MRHAWFIQGALRFAPPSRARAWQLVLEGGMSLTFTTDAARALRP